MHDRASRIATPPWLPPPFLLTGWDLIIMWLPTWESCDCNFQTGLGIRKRDTCRAATVFHTFARYFYGKFFTLFQIFAWTSRSRSRSGSYGRALSAKMTRDENYFRPPLRLSVTGSIDNPLARSWRLKPPRNARCVRANNKKNIAQIYDGL